MKTRFDFMGVKFSATNLQETVKYLKGYDFSNTGYVSFPDSSVVAQAHKDKELKNILNNALLTLPDGKPSQILARLQGYKNVSTVSGYWLCHELLSSDNISHYFLGSTPAKINKIEQVIKTEYPDARVLGYRSPAFYEVDEFRKGKVLREELEEINSLGPDLIWVGLSSPKQDYLLKYNSKLLKRGLMLGVGGVFDYMSGDVSKSPEWVKAIGLRWLWRLLKEPARLGPKYWETMKFMFLVLFNQKLPKKVEDKR